MARLVLGRRRAGVVASVLVAGLVVLCTAALTGAFAGTSNTTQTNSAKQQFAQHLLKTRVAQLMTWPAQTALRSCGISRRKAIESTWAIRKLHTAPAIARLVTPDMAPMGPRSCAWRRDSSSSSATADSSAIGRLPMWC
jgi:hypothetical protein